MDDSLPANLRLTLPRRPERKVIVVESEERRPPTFKDGKDGNTVFPQKKSFLYILCLFSLSSCLSSTRMVGMSYIIKGQRRFLLENPNIRQFGVIGLNWAYLSSSSALLWFLSKSCLCSSSSSSPSSPLSVPTPLSPSSSSSPVPAIPPAAAPWRGS